jgi:hypothetical protein
VAGCFAFHNHDNPVLRFLRLLAAIFPPYDTVPGIATPFPLVRGRATQNINPFDRGRCNSADIPVD